MKKGVVSVSFAICLMGYSNFSLAAIATTTFQVTATVVAACAVTATTMAFGTYNPVNNSSATATSTLATTCTTGTSYTIGLNQGTATGATVTTRKMHGGNNSANLLAYGLYQDAAHTINWGNTPGTDTPAAATGTGSPVSSIVYGYIAPLTSANIDTYSDTITVTVNF